MEIFHMFVIWYTSVLQFAINEAALSVIKWNKHLETFEPIYSLPSYEDDSQEIISPNRQDEARSFQGETLRVSFYQVAITLQYFSEKYVKFYDLSLSESWYFRILR